MAISVSMRLCLHCGASLSEQARFCGQCGQTIATAPAPEEATVRAKPNLAKTLLDPSPFGAAPEAPASQLATPLRPPPDPAAATAAAADPPKAPLLAKTIADPEMEERARAMRDAALASAAAAAPPPAAPAGALGKTMIQGGEAATAPAASPAPAPSRTPEASPLSRSVLAPQSWHPPPPDAAQAAATAAAAPLPAPTPGPGLQPAPAPQPAPPPATAPQLAPPPATAPQPAPQPAPIPAAQKTMLGMPARDLPAPAPAGPAFPAAQKTMLGVAIPGIAPTHDAPAAPPKASSTILGVAVPGIAPTREAAAAAPPPPYAAPVRPAPAPMVPPPPPLVEEPLPEAPRLPPKKGIPAVAVVAIVMLIVATLGGAGAYFALRSGPPLTAEAQLDEAGRESLRLRCASCPDETVVSLGAASATIKGQQAVLPLPAPLSIGDNDLVLHLDRPGAGRDEDVEIHVPVAYRVRADLASLTTRPPSITVRVEAAPGSEVTIGDTKLVLDASGRAAHVIPIEDEASGPSDEQRTVDRKIPFTIAPKGGRPAAGELTARAAIVPLHLDAPGLVLYTDKPTAPVAGQTRSNATVTIDGQATPVDAQGRFDARVPLAGPGERTVEIVSAAPPLAPRTVRARIVRVASLEGAAKELDGEGPLAFADFASNPAEHAGKDAVVEGEVVEVRSGGGYSVLLVDDKRSCATASCLVRVLHGEELDVARGDAVRAHGRVTGAVNASGKAVPELDAALVLRTARGGKR